MTPVTIVITARALFDCDISAQVYAQEGAAAFTAHHVTNEDTPLNPGPGFSFIKQLSHMEDPQTQENLFKVVLLSEFNLDSGYRVLRSIEHHNLQVDQSAFTGGTSQGRMLGAYAPDLFLSTDNDDVCAALAKGIAAARLYAGNYPLTQEKQLRIALDGDCVLFSDESERVFTSSEDPETKLANFFQFEKTHMNRPMTAGPFRAFLEKICALQLRFTPDKCPIRTALVTARSFPTYHRPVKTLRSWNAWVDEAYFMGGREKSPVLKAWQPSLFLDDQDKHCKLTAQIVPTGQVPTVTTERSNGT